MPEINDKCELIKSEKELEKALKDKKEFFVLFYASWCPFSQAFLPKFIESAKKSEQCHKRIVIDDKDELVEKYDINVYPTVLYFKDGKVIKRLDGVPHEGLNAPKLKGFIDHCVRKS